jgi:hypothetical protein
MHMMADWTRIDCSTERSSDNSPGVKCPLGLKVNCARNGLKSRMRLYKNLYTLVRYGFGAPDAANLPVLKHPGLVPKDRLCFGCRPFWAAGFC